MIEYQYEALGPAIQVIVLALLTVFALAVLALIVVLAGLPGRIAKARSHPQSESINIMGWLGSPTVVLWIIAMVWAFWRKPDNGSDSGLTTDQLRQLTQQIERLEQAIISREAR